MISPVGVDHAHPAAQLPRRGPQRVGDRGRRRARRHPAVGLGGDHGAVARGRHAAARARRSGRAARRPRATPSRRTRPTSSGCSRRAARRPARRWPTSERVLRIAAVTTAAESFVPGLMQAFSARASRGAARPRASATAARSSTGSLSHEADVAFGGRPPNDERIDARPFRPNELVLVGAADDPLAGGHPVSPARARRAHVAAARARLRDALGQRGVPVGQRAARRDADRRLQRRDPPGGPDRPRDLVPVGRRRDVGRRGRPARRDRHRSGAAAARVARHAPRGRPRATARSTTSSPSSARRRLSRRAAATAAWPKRWRRRWAAGARARARAGRRPRSSAVVQLEQQAVLPHAAGEHDGVEAARAGGLGARLRRGARDRAVEARARPPTRATPAAAVGATAATVPRASSTPRGDVERVGAALGAIG